MQINDILDLLKTKEHKESIGTKQEKTIHRFIKYLISQDESNHEVKLNKNIVDVYLNNQVYEIQTKQFNLLIPKFQNLLEQYKITVVYPIYSKTIIYKVDENEEIINMRTSPKKESLYTIGDELYKIKPYLKHPNLCFKIIDFTCIEYKYERLNKYKRKRLSSIDRVPKAINEIIDINDYHDWLIKFNIDTSFTRLDFEKHYKLSKRQAIAMLNVLTYLDLIKVIGKNKRAYIYQKNDRN